MSNLKISPEKAILLLNERIDDIITMRENQHGFEYYDFIGRCSKIWSVIDEIYGADDTHPEEIRSIGLTNMFLQFIWRGTTDAFRGISFPSAGLYQ